MDKQIYEKYYTYSSKGLIYVFNYGTFGYEFNYTFQVNIEPASAIEYNVFDNGLSINMPSAKYFFHIVHAVSFADLIEVKSKDDYIYNMKQEIKRVFR